MKVENWEDLRLFLHVAEQGGLAGAAEKTGISAPTIGRRMLALERATGRALFVRARTGYELAPDGQILLDRVRAMQEAAQDIVDWQETVHSMPIVRLISDNTMSCFTATSLRHLWTPHDTFRVCFKTTEAAIDLTHRDVDIGLAAERPQLGNVAVRRSVAVAYAPYCAQGFDHRRMQLGFAGYGRRQPAVEAVGIRTAGPAHHELGKLTADDVRSSEGGSGHQRDAMFHR